VKQVEEETVQEYRTIWTRRRRPQKSAVGNKATNLEIKESHDDGSW
jgi:hypothetical protein